ncbi:S1C family serine protease [Pseudogemmobacter faecipullorum]|uniref:Trypsin-like peptidase domain-containing protein n=1 Tax=Pseudogemmobacter faecipullorum TaxID=2755041 RepID=A0ABS8CJT3_9RHOB|nr:trypsin-like peptidase domain-containing protein [Pseudogemmobacter faecipullorum]MCB5409630.1 trypsin-like peptidase domain-containing protein [Pseudogemmobacter faecipullorum]
MIQKIIRRATFPVQGLRCFFMLICIAFFSLALLCPALARISDQPPPEARAGALETAMDAVLVLRSTDAAEVFLGSAFLWGSSSGIAVTNAHVVGTAEEVLLTDRLGRRETGEVIAIDRLRDVAVIAVGPGTDGQPRPGLTPLMLPAVLGTPVYALGAPLGAEFTLTLGMISAQARQVDAAVPLRLVQHDAAVNPGSSGGPLVDAEGRLIGMNSRIADGSRMFVGIAYAIAAPDLSRIVEGLILETALPFPKLGMTARPLDRKTAQALSLSVQGLLIDDIRPGGLAAAAGLEAGDLILAVAGQPLPDPGSFVFALEEWLAAGEARLTILRQGEERHITLSFSAGDPGPRALGLRLRDGPGEAALPEQIRSYRPAALGISLGENGRISALTENSPGVLAGLSRGDRVLRMNGQPVSAAAFAACEITGPTLLLVEAPDGSTRHLWLDPWGALGATRPAGGANVLDPAVVVF